MKCSRCGGQGIIHDRYIDKNVCILCGYEEGKMAEEIVAPKRRGGGVSWSKHKEIEEHKAELIDLYLQQGMGAVIRWGISAGGWRSIKRRWAGDIEQRRHELNGKGGPEKPGPGKPPEEVRVPTVGDRRRSDYDWEAECRQIEAEYAGYRKAVQDITRSKAG